MDDSFKKLFYDLLEKWESAEEQLNDEFGFSEVEKRNIESDKMKFIERFKKLSDNS